jgi:hypothetical protein
MTSLTAYNIQGTLPFISIELLKTSLNPIEHSEKHDLESFFYVLLYICTMYDGPGIWKLNGNRQDPNHPFGTWLDTEIHWHGIASYRLAQFADPDTAHGMVFKHVSPYFKPLVPLLSDLCDAIFGAFKFENQTMWGAGKARGSHTTVLMALRKAYDELPLQDDVAAGAEEESWENGSFEHIVLRSERIPGRRPPNIMLAVNAGVEHIRSRDMGGSDSGYGGEEILASTSFHAGSGSSKEGRPIFPAREVIEDGNRRCSSRLLSKRRSNQNAPDIATIPSPKRHRSGHSNGSFQSRSV